MAKLKANRNICNGIEECMLHILISNESFAIKTKKDENKKKQRDTEKFTIKTPFISAMIIYGIRIPKRILDLDKMHEEQIRQREKKNDKNRKFIEMD